MPPRHTKSEFSSFLLPAWMIGRNPKLKLFNRLTTELAVRFGRKAKTLMDSSTKVFNTRLRQDSQAAGKWKPNKAVNTLQPVLVQRLQVVVQIY